MFSYAQLGELRASKQTQANENILDKIHLDVNICIFLIFMHVLYTFIKQLRVNQEQDKLLRKCKSFYSGLEFYREAKYSCGTLEGM